jgi:DNA modification methylase
MCIKLHGVKRSHRVLEPFLGIGQSAVAARRLGKNFVGFEIDAKYFREACKRVKSLTQPLQNFNVQPYNADALPLKARERQFFSNR